MAEALIKKEFKRRLYFTTPVLDGPKERIGEGTRKLDIEDNHDRQKVKLTR